MEAGAGMERLLTTMCYSTKTLLDTWGLQGPRKGVPQGILSLYRMDRSPSELWGKVLWMALNESGARKLSVILFSLCAYEIVDSSGRDFPVIAFKLQLQ